ncbi:MAG: hypothetical protein R2790_02155 [Flavobacterium haoranii]
MKNDLLEYDYYRKRVQKECLVILRWCERHAQNAIGLQTRKKQPKERIRFLCLKNPVPAPKKKRAKKKKWQSHAIKLKATHQRTKSAHKRQKRQKITEKGAKKRTKNNVLIVLGSLNPRWCHSKIYLRCFRQTPNQNLQTNHHKLGLGWQCASTRMERLC